MSDHFDSSIIYVAYWIVVGGSIVREWGGSGTVSQGTGLTVLTGAVQVDA